MAQRLHWPIATSSALATLALLVTLPAFASEASVAQDDGIAAQFNEYVGAQQALAADDADGARAALERLLAVADDVTRPPGAGRRARGRHRDDATALQAAVGVPRRPGSAPRLRSSLLPHV